MTNSRAFVWAVALATSGVSGAACTVLGPSCIGRQQRGHVASVSGAVAAGGLASHRFAYNVSGSQHDIEVRWEGQDQLLSAGPRARFFVTRTACERFVAPQSPPAAACEILATAGVMPDGALVTSMVVTHGRGNPEVLGTPAAFAVWVVAEGSQPVRYALDITWRSGPDC